MLLRVLFVGDIVGNPGRKALDDGIASLKEDFDLIVINAENAAGGFGLTESVARELFKSGAAVLTSGNHIWDKKEALDLLESDPRIIRPLNYAPGVPGKGSTIVTTPGGYKVGVMNLSGRVFMNPMDCPFRTSAAAVEQMRKETSVIIMDFHAEATSEKIAMGYHLDGKVSAVLGTHTHVQTADERILEGGTAYITDVGMTGPVDGVIGVDRQQILDRFLLGMPNRYEVAKGRNVFNAVMLEIDSKTGRAESIKRIYKLI